MRYEQINEEDAAAIRFAASDPIKCEETFAEAQKSLIVSMTIIVLAIVAVLIHAISFIPFVAVWIVFNLRAMDSMMEMATAKAKAVG
jgi:glucan phosphoethanolaminetransferase (alkaline phosphatase superfamily)